MKTSILVFLVALMCRVALADFDDSRDTWQVAANEQAPKKQGDAKAKSEGASQPAKPAPSARPTQQATTPDKSKIEDIKATWTGKVVLVDEKGVAVAYLALSDFMISQENLGINTLYVIDQALSKNNKRFRLTGKKAAATQKLEGKTIKVDGILKGGQTIEINSFTEKENQSR